MEDAPDPKSLVAVTNLREFFHDSVQTALRKQQVAVDDHTEHYVVNVLTQFARSDELYEQTPEGTRLKPLAHMLAEASEAPTQQQRDHALRRLGDVLLTNYRGRMCPGKACRRFCRMRVGMWLISRAPFVELRVIRSRSCGVSSAD